MTIVGSVWLTIYGYQDQFVTYVVHGAATGGTIGLFVVFALLPLAAIVKGATGPCYRDQMPKFHKWSTSTLDWWRRWLPFT
jgi:hypothetical protein